MPITCSKCNVELNDDNWYPSWKIRNNRVCNKCVLLAKRQWRAENKEKSIAQLNKWRRANPDKTKASSARSRRKQGSLPYQETPSCTLFLGVHIAERILSRIFKDVKQMPMHNRGYDFVCNKGKKIDVKSSCIAKDGQWVFRIGRNTIADYFLCLAFNNRIDLNPIHLWMIPGDVINDHQCTGIRPTTIGRWKEYELDITKISACCNIIKNKHSLEAI